MKLSDIPILVCSFAVAVVGGALLVWYGVDALLAAAVVPSAAAVLTGVSIGVRDRVLGWNF